MIGEKEKGRKSLSSKEEEAGTVKWEESNCGIQEKVVCKINTRFKWTVRGEHGERNVGPFVRRMEGRWGE